MFLSRYFHFKKEAVVVITVVIAHINIEKETDDMFNYEWRTLRKSSYAENLAKRAAMKPIYVATARKWDDDFKKRVDRHQKTATSIG
jgi:hypothetical protein